MIFTSRKLTARNLTAGALRHIFAAATALAVLLVAYLLGGDAGAFVAGCLLFAIAVLVARAGVAAPDSAAEQRPGPLGADPRAGYADFARLEGRLFSALYDRRIYDRSVRPRLYALATALLEARRGEAINADDVRAVVDEQLWPLLRPGGDEPDGTPPPDPDQLDALLRTLEAMA